MASSRFKQACRELCELNLYHAALFVVCLALTTSPQKSLKPAGVCGERLYDDYQLVVTLAYFTIMYTFCSFALTSNVNRRVPDGGLQGVASVRARALLRVDAALGCVANAAATVFAVSSITYLLQAKLGAFSCLPVWARAGVYVTFVLIFYVFSRVYFHAARLILLHN